MKVITTHRSPDFDAFASCVAAKKLFPEHLIVLPGNPARNLSEFLKIYSDRFEFLWEHEFDGEVSDLVIVDTSSLDRIPERIRERIRDAKITVFDHHVDEKSLDGVVDRVGATITLLVERLRKEGISIDATEATLFMIALYDDTGNLLFPRPLLAILKLQSFCWKAEQNLMRWHSTRKKNSHLNRWRYWTGCSKTHGSMK